MNDSIQKVLAKLHLVMAEVEYIQKDGKVEHGQTKYKYASEYAIKSAVGKAFRKNKVLFQLNTHSPHIECTGKDKYDKDVLIIVMDCDYIFYDVDSGEHIEGRFAAFGPSRDDKGGWAATTNVIKYILTSTFLVPTGDDVEGPLHNKEPEPPATKKTTKKKAAGKKAEPPKNELDEAMGGGIDHKATFTATFTERCKQQNITINENVKMVGWAGLYGSDLIPQICKTTGYDAPVADMPPEHTGWLVMNQIAKTFNFEAAIQKAFTESGMQ